MISVWVYDDLWDEGYRFDDIITKRRCFITTEFAKNEHEALDILSKIYRYVKKEDGNSKRNPINEQILNSLVLVIEEI